MGYLKWPKNNRAASIDDIIEPIIESLKFAYELKRVNKGKSIPYSGLPLPRSFLVGDFQIKKKFSRKHLQWQFEEHGREALRIILCTLMQLGIEQGNRINDFDMSPIRAIKKLWKDEQLQAKDAEIAKRGEALKELVDSVTELLAFGDIPLQPKERHEAYYNVARALAKARDLGVG